MTPGNKQLPNRGTGKRSKKARTQNVIKNKSNWFHSVYSTRLASNVLDANVALIWHSKASSVHLSNCRLNSSFHTNHNTGALLAPVYHNSPLYIVTLVSHSDFKAVPPVCTVRLPVLHFQDRLLGMICNNLLTPAQVQKPRLRQPAAD